MKSPTDSDPLRVTPSSVAAELNRLGLALTKIGFAVRSLEPHIGREETAGFEECLRDAIGEMIEIRSRILTGRMPILAPERAEPAAERPIIEAIERNRKPLFDAIADPAPTEPRNGFVELEAPADVIEPDLERMLEAESEADEAERTGDPIQSHVDRVDRFAADEAEAKRARKRASDAKYAQKKREAKALEKALGNPVENTGPPPEFVGRLPVITGPTAPVERLAPTPGDFYTVTLDSTGEWHRCHECLGDYDHKATAHGARGCHRTRLEVLALVPCKTMGWDQAPIEELPVPRAIRNRLLDYGAESVGMLDLLIQEQSIYSAAKLYPDEATEVLIALAAFKRTCVPVGDLPPPPPPPARPKRSKPAPEPEPVERLAPMLRKFVVIDYRDREHGEKSGQGYSSIGDIEAENLAAAKVAAAKEWPGVPPEVMEFEEIDPEDEAPAPTLVPDRVAEVEACACSRCNQVRNLRVQPCPKCSSPEYRVIRVAANSIELGEPPKPKRSKTVPPCPPELGESWCDLHPPAKPKRPKPAPEPDPNENMFVYYAQGKGGKCVNPVYGIRAPSLSAAIAYAKSQHPKDAAFEVRPDLDGTVAKRGLSVRDLIVVPEREPPAGPGREWDIFDSREKPPRPLGRVSGANLTRAGLAAEQQWPDVPRRLFVIEEVGARRAAAKPAERPKRDPDVELKEFRSEWDQEGEQSAAAVERREPDRPARGRRKRSEAAS